MEYAVDQKCNENLSLHRSEIDRMVKIESMFGRYEQWYLSFADKDSWKGAIVTIAPGFVSALDHVNSLKINPGGEVKGIGLQVHRDVPVEDRNRLLTLQECKRIFGVMVNSKGETA
jgi:hypothetical protein